MLRSMLRASLKWLLILSLFSATEAFAQGQVAGPPNAILCNQAAQVTVTAVSSIFAGVSGVTGQRVYICGWHVTAQSSGGTFQVITGTSSGTTINCLGGVAGSGVPGTGSTTVPVSTTTLTPSLAVSSTAPATDHIDYAMLQGTISQPLCIAATTLSSLAIMVYFSQF